MGVRKATTDAMATVTTNGSGIAQSLRQRHWGKNARRRSFRLGESDLVLFDVQILMTKQITIKTPSDFNFQRTVLSHGWCELLPFELDRRNWILTRVLDVGRAR